MLISSFLGRTGRSNQTGTAYTLFTPQNGPKANDLINVLREANQVVNPRLHEMSMGGYGKGMSSFRSYHDSD